MKCISEEFYSWIHPLLEHPEDKILLNHTAPASRGFRLIKRQEAMRKYRLTEYQIYRLLWKLETLALLYEFQASVGLH